MILENIDSDAYADNGFIYFSVFVSNKEKEVKDRGERKR